MEKVSMTEIYMATGNSEKFTIAVNQLLTFNISLIQKPLDLFEIQEDSIEKIARHKAVQAFEISHTPIVIQDTGWSIPSLNGFPGPYMHYISNWFSTDDFLRLFDGLPNKTIMVEDVVAYCNSSQIKIFKSIQTGEILDSAKGNGLPIDQIVSFRSDHKSIAETKTLNLPWADNKTDIDCWVQFGKWHQLNFQRN